jgi:NO-binding membrane sensor protein with MHYT domain
MLIVSYSPLLVLGAALVALMAAFTGLHLTHGLSRLPAEARKPQIVKAAIVLGGGVWSTHFVAMLALDLPVAVLYDALFTLASALIAILLAGAALLILHFGPRGASEVGGGRISVAGGVLGLGVVAMHYVGMLGMRGCAPVFAPAGYGLSSLFAVGMGIGALKLAYGRRTRAALTLGAVIFAAAILAMHFTAMAWTGFLPVEALEARPGLVAHEILALFVVVAAFLICGAFLLTTATLVEDPGATAAAATTARVEAGPMALPAEAKPAEATPPVARVAPVVASSPATRVGPMDAEPAAVAPSVLRRVPYEQDGRTYFLTPEEILAVQAEGHYTRLHRMEGALFCPLAIARLEPALTPQNFVRTHRSYLVNLRHVRGFERRKDQGVCLFDPEAKVPPVPVSRARVAPIMRALGLREPAERTG